MRLRRLSYTTLGDATDFPPFTTVQYHFYRMRDSGLLDAINAVLVAGIRLAEGRTAEPIAGIIALQFRLGASR